MNKELFYSGKQIKNYLVAFGSVFSEIPFLTSRGKIDTVPIIYGSQSDISAFLEQDVDHDEVKNQNRLKDITIPFLSFRMTGMQRRSEARRAPFEQLTIDLRQLGYGTGYTIVNPAPFVLTFELVLWASSDQQCFEILENILPYFNSPQQIIIEPILRSPITEHELSLDTIDIDTDPSSQRYGAQATMTFNLNSWLLAQPKIWTTNLAFELKMLDEKPDLSNPIYAKIAEEYDLGTEIKEYEKQQSFSKNKIVDDYILTPLEKTHFEMFKQLVAQKIIDDNCNVLDSSITEFMFDLDKMTITPEFINLIASDIKNIQDRMINDKLSMENSKNTFDAQYAIFDNMLTDKNSGLDIFAKLLKVGIATENFNLARNLTNTEKLNMFGTLNVGIDGILSKLKIYESAISSLILTTNDMALVSNVIPVSLTEKALPTGTVITHTIMDAVVLKDSFLIIFDIDLDISFEYEILINGAKVDYKLIGTNKIQIDLDLSSIEFDLRMNVLNSDAQISSSNWVSIKLDTNKTKIKSTDGNIILIELILDLFDESVKKDIQTKISLTGIGHKFKDTVITVKKLNNLSQEVNITKSC